MKHAFYYFLLINFAFMAFIITNPLGGKNRSGHEHDLQLASPLKHTHEKSEKYPPSANPKSPIYHRESFITTLDKFRMNKFRDPVPGRFFPAASSNNFEPEERSFSKDWIPESSSITGNYADSVELAWIRHYASGLAPTDDYATAVVVDASGYIFVTGNTLNGISGYDFYTIKYDLTGNEIWARQYNSESNLDDYARAIAVDGIGNVFVTGLSLGSDISSDYITIKYNSNGDPVWVRKYDGVGNSHDDVAALAIDGNGNVYVTGSSYGLETSYDYATIKYNSSGSTVWIRRYNGPGNFDDDARAIAVDDSENVYVTGGSYGSGTSSDYTTIKYNSNGNALWVQRYDGPGNIWDAAGSLAIDGSGNVYITGGSFGSGTSSSYATIKYNSSGEMVWLRRYDGPGNGWDDASALAVDGNGNVYITGESYGSGTSYDYATIKYNSNGDTVWIQRYDGLGNYWDYATSLAIDGNGNVYITGESYGSGTYSDYATIMYDPNGDTCWVRRFNGPGYSDDYATSIAVDGSGNVYVTGGSDSSSTSSDYFTIKYNSSGDTSWTKRYGGSGNTEDYAQALTVDETGNVYITGQSYSTGSSFDYATIKYNSNGDTVWVRRFDGPDNSVDFASDLNIDKCGNVYVTGRSFSSFTEYDYATIKYDSNGDTVWIRRYNGPDNSDDYASDLDIDKDGNVYITGGSFSSSSGSDYATIKYDSNGNTVWIKRYNGPGNYDDFAYTLAIDESGNVYVTGESFGAGYSSDYATIKYNSNGDTVWVRRFNCQGNYYDSAVSLVIDRSGNVYITGQSSSLGTSIDYATIKYNSNGDTVWIRRYNGPDNSEDYASDLSVDSNGNVYVTGGSFSSNTGFDYATIKYDSNGDTVWIRRYNGPGNYQDFANALTIDRSGNVYVTGRSVDSGNSLDYTTIKYTSAGEEEWIAKFAGPGYAHDSPVGISVDTTASIYLTGSSYDQSERWSIFTTIKYNQIPVFIISNEPEVPDFFSLDQNYPNPFNPTTNISWQLAVGSLVRLSLFDVSGQKIADLVNEDQPAGTHQIEFDASKLASGVYFYRLSTESLSGKGVMFSQTRKLLLLR